MRVVVLMLPPRRAAEAVRRGASWAPGDVASRVWGLASCDAICAHTPALEHETNQVGGSASTRASALLRRLAGIRAR